jgi:hypothetical protein
MEQQHQQEQVEQQEQPLKENKDEEIRITLTEAEIIQVLKTRFHDFEKVVGRKMTYAEEREYGEARDIRG